MARKFTPGISYVHQGLQPFCISVYFDGKVVGYIRREANTKHGKPFDQPFNYYYQPRSSRRGEFFLTVDAVKASIEGRGQ